MDQPPLSRRELRERERRRSPAVAIIIGVLALAVVAAALWFGRGLLTADSTTDPTAGPAGATGSTGSASTTATSAPTTSVTVDPLAAAVADCAVAWKLQSAATAAAQTALLQWKNHLDIMNRLQAGQLTLAQAKTLWAPTTAKAPENVAAFRAADKALAAAKVACAAPAEGVTGEQADALRQCAQAWATVDGALKQARVAIAPWEEHLLDQSHFKSGDVTSAQAEAAWRVLWKKGVATMPAYLAAQGRAETAKCSLAS